MICTFSISLIPLGIIIVSSLWTLAFTRGFLRKNLRRHQQNLNASNFKVQEHIYSARVKNLIGIFGILILFNALSWSPYIVASCIGIIVGTEDIPREVYATAFVLFLFNNVSNPVIQICFRKDLLNFISSTTRKMTGTCRLKRCQDSSVNSISLRQRKKACTNVNCREAKNNDIIVLTGVVQEIGFRSAKPCEVEVCIPQSSEDMTSGSTARI